VRVVGGGEVVLEVRLAGTLDSRLWEADGGVRGRELLPETVLQQSAWHKQKPECMYRLSNFSMSACE
jgi:hypothetical protein